MYDEPTTTPAAALRQHVIGPGHEPGQLLEPGHDSSPSILGFDGKLATWLATFDADTGPRGTAENPIKQGHSPSGWRDLNSRPLDPQTSAACPRMSPHGQFSLKIRILYLGVFRWTNPNGGQDGGQPHSQTKRRGPLQRMTSHRAFDVTTNGFRSLLQQFGRRRCAAMLYLDRAFKAHLRA